MSEEIWSGEGIDVATYCGLPVHTGRRRRIQITNMLTGEFVTLNDEQAAALFTAAHQIETELW